MGHIRVPRGNPLAVLSALPGPGNRVVTVMNNEKGLSVAGQAL